MLTAGPESQEYKHHNKENSNVFLCDLLNQEKIQYLKTDYISGNKNIRETRILENFS